MYIRHTNSVLFVIIIITIIMFCFVLRVRRQERRAAARPCYIVVRHKSRNTQIKPPGSWDVNNRSPDSLRDAVRVYIPSQN